MAVARIHMMLEKVELDPGGPVPDLKPSVPLIGKSALASGRHAGRIGRDGDGVPRNRPTG